MNGLKEHFNQKEAIAIMKHQKTKSLNIIYYVITTANNKNNQKSRNYFALIKDHN